MGLFRSSELLGIAEETLEFVLNASEDTHPNEYMGFLRADDAGKLGLDRQGQVLTDILVIPGTESSPWNATVKTHMQPNNIQSVGSVHSHPNGVLRPSDADLGAFGRGSVHIIVGAPYQRDNWQAFDNAGEPIELDVLDVKLPEQEFFELTKDDVEREMIDGTRETDEAGLREIDENALPSERDDRKDGGLFSWLR